VLPPHFILLLQPHADVLHASGNQRGSHTGNPGL
jgi:hypothetical protein